MSTLEIVPAEGVEKKEGEIILLEKCEAGNVVVLRDGTKALVVDSGDVLRKDYSVDEKGHSSQRTLQDVRRVSSLYFSFK